MTPGSRTKKRGGEADALKPAGRPAPGVSSSVEHNDARRGAADGVQDHRVRIGRHARG